MAQRVVGAQQTCLIGHGSHIFIEHLLRVDDGTDLQEVELARAVVVEVAGKLDLHGAAHALGAVAHGHL